MNVNVNINKNWKSNNRKGLDAGLLELVTDIHRRSNMLAPVDTRAMVNSSIIKMLGALAYAIKYGSSRVPYARRQFFEHKTKSHYLTKGAESVLRGDYGKYYRGKV